MRLPTSQRRAQIVDCALEMLAVAPVARLTTRALARQVGISQPALFRHYPSRDAILAAVVARVRETLQPVIAEALQAGGMDGVRVLVAGLFRTVEEMPGLPRLLYHDLAVASEKQGFGRDLRLLVSMQRNLVAELVRTAQTAGGPESGSLAGQGPALNPELDPERSARLLVALVQGSLLQRRLLQDAAADHTAAMELVDFWCAGLAAMDSASAAPDPGVSTVPGSRGVGNALQELDVRPLLDEGTDPLQHILQRLDSLPRQGLLLLVAPFRPDPLLGVLHGRGFRTLVRADGPHLWRIEIQAPGCTLVDLCNLEAPGPMERILLLCAGLEAGQNLLARVPRTPQLLLPRLAERGLQWRLLDCGAGQALILVHRPPMDACGPETANQTP